MQQNESAKYFYGDKSYLYGQLADVINSTDEIEEGKYYERIEINGDNFMGDEIIIQNKNCIIKELSIQSLNRKIKKIMEFKTS